MPQLAVEYLLSADAHEASNTMKAIRFFGQVLAGALAMIIEGLIHYKVHPINEVNTVKDAFIVAFSFWPGMLIGYLVIWIQRHLARDEEPEAPAAAALCAVLWFVYLLRALTLLMGLPVLSNWTQQPVTWIVKFFELFIEHHHG